MRYPVSVYAFQALLAMDVAANAQQIEIYERQSNDQAGLYICISSGGAKSCNGVDLDPRDLNSVYAILHLQRLQEIQGAASQTSERVQGVSDQINALNDRVDALSSMIDTTYNNQLSAIRDQLIAKMESLPLMMIDDEAVIREIRSLVIEEVEAAFIRRE
jgi:CII-binding regulator of phage lambda lysogenization HflD